MYVKLRGQVALRGQKVHGKRKLRIQGHMQIFEKISQMALNHDLRPDSESWDRDLQSGGIKTRFKVFFSKICMQPWICRLRFP